MIKAFAAFAPARPAPTLRDSLRAGTVKSDNPQPVRAALSRDEALRVVLLGTLPNMPVRGAANVLADVLGEMVARGAWSQDDANAVASAVNGAAWDAARGNVVHAVRGAGV